MITRVSASALTRARGGKDTAVATEGQSIPPFAPLLTSPLSLCPTAALSASLSQVELVSEGFDPRVIRDPLFFRDETARTFVPLDAALFQRIQTGQIRL